MLVEGLSRARAAGKGSSMRSYSTSEIAKLAHVHPNTVRLYEEWGYISPVDRRNNGYRRYTELHAWQMKVARTAFRCEIIQGNLRSLAREIVKAAGRADFGQAGACAERFLRQLQLEHARAMEAAEIAGAWLHQAKSPERDVERYTRKQAAELIDVSVDVVRNWERNGLLKVPRLENGYRVYSGSEINRMKIIRALRSAHYSMSSILRLFLAVENGPGGDIVSLLNTSRRDEDIVTLTDRLIYSLEDAMKHADEIMELMEHPGELSRSLE